MTRNKWVYQIRPYVIQFAMKSGLFKVFARRLLLNGAPLPISKEFTFET